MKTNLKNKKGKKEKWNKLSPIDLFLATMFAMLLSMILAYTR